MGLCQSWHSTTLNLTTDQLLKWSSSPMPQLRPYVEFGISHFIVLVNDLPTFNRFRAEVVPAFA